MPASSGSSLPPPLYISSGPSLPPPLYIVALEDLDELVLDVLDDLDWLLPLSVDFLWPEKFFDFRLEAREFDLKDTREEERDVLAEALELDLDLFLDLLELAED